MVNRTLTYLGLVILAGALLFWTPVTVKAGSTTGSVMGQVLADLSIIQEQSLSFGQVAVSPTASGTVTVNAGGTSVTGGVQSISPGNRGQFKFSGAPNAFFVFMATSPVFNISNGSSTMQVTITNPFLIGSLSSAGVYTHRVNGIMNVNAGQAAGAYIGTYPVTLMYF